MKVKLLILVALLVVAVGVAYAWDHDPLRAKRLTCQIDYWISDDFGETDPEGRMLIWEGTIQGDLNGTMKWWFGPNPAPNITYQGGRVSYYAARWEIWDSTGTRLLLAGDSAGKTVTPVEADGMWDGHGVVKQVRRVFKRLKGRHIYETGPVQGTFPELYGTGIFVIY